MHFVHAGISELICASCKYKIGGSAAREQKAKRKSTTMTRRKDGSQDKLLMNCTAGLAVITK